LDPSVQPWPPGADKLGSSSTLRHLPLQQAVTHGAPGGPSIAAMPRSAIITSQLPHAEWHVALGDPTIADAICDQNSGIQCAEFPEPTTGAVDVKQAFIKNRLREGEGEGVGDICDGTIG
jgi:hypothetical protein